MYKSARAYWDIGLPGIKGLFHSHEKHCDENWLCVILGLKTAELVTGLEEDELDLPEQELEQEPMQISEPEPQRRVLRPRSKRTSKPSTSEEVGEDQLQSN